MGACTVCQLLAHKTDCPLEITGDGDCDSYGAVYIWNLVSLGSRPSPFTHAYISKGMRYPDSITGEGLGAWRLYLAPGLKYHVRVGSGTTR